ncbi:hypothetical protein ACFX11_041480 [Malus domestica]
MEVEDESLEEGEVEDESLEEGELREDTVMVEVPRETTNMGALEQFNEDEDVQGIHRTAASVNHHLHRTVL